MGSNFFKISVLLIGLGLAGQTPAAAPFSLDNIFGTFNGQHCSLFIGRNTANDNKLYFIATVNGQQRWEFGVEEQFSDQLAKQLNPLRIHTVRTSLGSVDGDYEIELSPSGKPVYIRGQRHGWGGADSFICERMR